MRTVFYFSAVFGSAVQFGLFCSALDTMILVLVPLTSAYQKYPYPRVAGIHF